MGQRKALKEIKRFEVYWAALDPALGFEMQKTRPCVVLTNNIMNELLETIVIAPITSTRRQLPFRLPVKLNGKDGEIALDQMRAVDKSRLGKRMAVIDGKAEQEILEILAEMFAQ